MAYQIADEPAPTELSHYVVRPTAPLMAVMLCGAWLAWPWFAFNAYAMGSPTKKKEIALCLGAFAVTAVLGALWVFLVDSDIITSRLWARLTLLAIITFKVGASYYICSVQNQTFHVYQYYGGAVAAARKVLAAGLLLRSFVIGAIDDPLWIIVVMGVL